jgi:hypothetical protein
MFAHIVASVKMNFKHLVVFVVHILVLLTFITDKALLMRLQML